MNPTFTHEADYRRERDFGAKINATFGFLKAQFRPLLKCLLYFVLPGALLTGIGIGLFFGRVMAAMPKPGQPFAYGPKFIPGVSDVVGLFGGGLGALVAALLLISTVYAFVRVRLDLPADEEVQPAQVWAYIRPRLGRMLLAMLLLSGLSLIAFFVWFGSMFGVVHAQSEGDGFSSALAVLGSMMLFFIPIMWFSIVLTQYFPVLWLEDEGVWAALRRSFYLIRGKWWSTFGLLMIVGMIQSVFTFVFVIPLYGSMALTLLKIPGFGSPVVSVIGSCIYSIGIMLTYTIPLVAIMFQYFNLVERRDAYGLRLLVSRLGQTPAPETYNSQLRPDEQGEY